MSCTAVGLPGISCTETGIVLAASPAHHRSALTADETIESVQGLQTPAKADRAF